MDAGGLLQDIKLLSRPFIASFLEQGGRSGPVTAATLGIAFAAAAYEGGAGAWFVSLF